MAPWLTKAASKESEDGKKAGSDQNQCFTRTMSERNVAPASVSSQVPVAPTQESVVWLQEGSQVMGFGFYPEFTYREAWNWICAGTATLNDLLHGSNIVSAKVMNFLNWMQKLQQVIGDVKKEETCRIIHFVWVGNKPSAMGFFR